MKKLVLATTVVAACATAAFASAPVTEIEGGVNQVGLGYGWHQSIHADGESVSGHGLAADLQVGLSNNLAAEFAHTRMTLNGDRAYMNTFSGYYKLTDMINAYASVGKATEMDWGYQVGLVGHMPLSDRTEGFVKAGIGTKALNSTVQLGVKYHINENVNVNAYYKRDGFKDDGESAHGNGFYTGVGYKF